MADLNISVGDVKLTLDVDMSEVTRAVGKVQEAISSVVVDVEGFSLAIAGKFTNLRNDIETMIDSIRGINVVQPIPTAPTVVPAPPIPPSVPPVTPIPPIPPSAPPVVPVPPVPSGSTAPSGTKQSSILDAEPVPEPGTQSQAASKEALANAKERADLEEKVEKLTKSINELLEERKRKRLKELYGEEGDELSKHTKELERQRELLNDIRKAMDPDLLRERVALEKEIEKARKEYKEVYEREARSQETHNERATRAVKNPTQFILDSIKDMLAKPKTKVEEEEVPTVYPLGQKPWNIDWYKKERNESREKGEREHEGPAEETGLPPTTPRYELPDVIKEAQPPPSIQAFSPGPKGTDKKAAWLTEGEEVINAKSANEYRSLLKAINEGGVQNFSSGGSVSSSGPLYLAGGGGSGGSAGAIGGMIGNLIAPGIGEEIGRILGQAIPDAIATPAKLISNSLGLLSSSLSGLQGLLGPVGVGFDLLGAGIKSFSSLIKSIPIVGEVLGPLLDAFGSMPGLVKSITETLTRFGAVASPAHMQQLERATQDVQGVIGQSFLPMMELIRNAVVLFGDVLATLLPSYQEMREILAPLTAEFNEFRDVINEFLVEFGPLIKGFLVANLQLLTMAATVAAAAVTELIRAISGIFGLSGIMGAGTVRSGTGYAARPASFSGFDEYERELQKRAFTEPGVPTDRDIPGYIAKIHDMIKLMVAPITATAATATMISTQLTRLMFWRWGGPPAPDVGAPPAPPPAGGP